MSDRNRARRRAARRRYVVFILGLLMTGICLLAVGVGGGALLGIYKGDRDVRATEAADLRAETELQYQLALEDMEAGNYERARERLWWVINMNRAYLDAEERYEYLTWVLENPPTPTPTATPPPTPEPGEIPPTPLIDADAVFAAAETAYQAQDWETTIDQLDTLMGAAPGYKPEEAREMLFNALVELGAQRFNQDRLEEGVNLVDRAAIYGPVSQEMLSKRNLAAEYLRATGYLGVNWDTAITLLYELYLRVPEYRDVKRRLLSAYIGYGDSFANRGDYCPAVPLYQSAIDIIYDPDVQRKRDEAQSLCASATPTPAPTVEPTLVPGAIGVTVYSQANLRLGPSTQHDILETLGGGTLLSAIGRNADSSWLFVSAPSSARGWVSVEVVNTELVDTSTLPVTEEPGSPAAPAPAP